MSFLVSFENAPFWETSPNSESVRFGGPPDNSDRVNVIELGKDAGG